MIDHAHKIRAFRALHTRPGTFMAPNPWDPGSARILQGLGFAALSTTSGGFALSRGLRDGEPDREAVLAHAAEIAAATEVPVSADLEAGFGPRPEDVAHTVSRAIELGLAGGSIEDYTGEREAPLYPIELAAERVRAAVEAARASGFVLTARAENFFRGRPDLADTIRRLQA